MPGDDIQRRVIEGGRPERATEFLEHPDRAVAVLERRNGRLEVARIGEAVGADRPELGQA